MGKGAGRSKPGGGGGQSEAAADGSRDRGGGRRVEEAGEQEARGLTEKVCGGRGREVRSEVVSNGQAGGASQAVEAGGHQRVSGGRRQ